MDAAAIAFKPVILTGMAGRDADAIQAVVDGDVERYAELVDKYQRPILRLAFSLLGNEEDAKDAAQEAFIRAFRALGRFKFQAEFSTWLYRIVVNSCRDAEARRRRHAADVVIGTPNEDDSSVLFVDVDDPSIGPGDQLVNRELAAQLSRAIRRLAAHQRTAFVLHHLEGLSLQEAAQVTGCRVGTVKSHLFRAMDHLRKQLKPFVTEEA